ncbi:MAG: M48 family metallopeptidase [Sulfurimonadaceae bacterium]|jgi:STE24 endopeptidase|nr:M48 family metallopeptidase [Sulfurimonadaceae bacterium]
MLMGLVLAYTLYVLVSIYVSVMQIGFISRAKNGKAILLGQNDFIKAASYGIAKERFSIVHNFVDYLVFVAWIGFGIKALEQSINFSSDSVQNIAIVVSFLLVGAVLSLPFSYYEKFVLDEKFGFNKSSKAQWLRDTFISFVTTIVLGSLIVWGVYIIIVSTELWWFWSFVFLMVVVVAINMLFPTFRAMFFDKLTPLEDKELDSSIKAMMDRVGFESSGVFVSDASKRDARLNAYFGGLGKSKRVVLFDTLIQKLTPREILAVLGHELGHFAHKDIYKNIAMVAVMMFGLFAFFGNIPDELYMSLGVLKAPYTIMILLMLFMPVIGFFIMPIYGSLSRHNEYEADKMGSELGGAVELANALKKLVEENKSFPLSHPIYIFFHYSHPPVIERLKELGVDIDSSNEAMVEHCQADI